MILTFSFFFCYSNDEDLEDGEIFDDEEENALDNEAPAAMPSDNGKQQSDGAACNTNTGGIQNSEEGNVSKDSAVPNLKPQLGAAAVADSSISSGGNLKNSEQQSGYGLPWKNSVTNTSSVLDNLSKKVNSYNDDDKRSNKDKKKKRKRMKDGDDDEKHVKEKVYLFIY